MCPATRARMFACVRTCVNVRVTMWCDAQALLARTDEAGVCTALLATCALFGRGLWSFANPVLMTGPGFVTKDNALRVIDLSKAGTR